MEIDEIRTKIEDWINNDSMKRLIVIPEQYDPVKFPFLLSVKRNDPKIKEIPLSIFKPLEYKDKISVYARIIFDEDQKNSWKILSSDFKEQVLVDLSQGLFIMSLISKFHPNRDDLEQIIFQEMIYFDGLTKDRIMKSITKVLSAYGYITAILIKHNILRKSFDPSDYI